MSTCSQILVCKFQVVSPRYNAEQRWHENLYTISGLRRTGIRSLNGKKNVINGILVEKSLGGQCLDGWMDDINFKCRWRILSPWFPVKGNTIENCNLASVSGLKTNENNSKKTRSG